jgi:hypothetical protein
MYTIRASPVLACEIEKFCDLPYCHLDIGLGLSEVHRATIANGCSRRGGE